MRIIFILFFFIIFSCSKESDPCDVMCDNCMGLDQCEECYDNCYKSLNNE